MKGSKRYLNSNPEIPVTDQNYIESEKDVWDMVSAYFQTIYQARGDKLKYRYMSQESSWPLNVEPVKGKAPPLVKDDGSVWRIKESKIPGILIESKLLKTKGVDQN